MGRVNPGDPISGRGKCACPAQEDGEGEVFVLGTFCWLFGELGHPSKWEQGSTQAKSTTYQSM